MLTKEQQTDVAEILRLLDEALKDYLQRHNYGHKSSENAVSLHFGNFWDRDGWDNPGTPGEIGVEVYSYALGPIRSHYFKSISEALAEVRRWHKGQTESADDRDGGWDE